MNTLKLNYKRTFFIGLAFFTILMLWQVYNFYVPLMIEDLLVYYYGPGDYNYLKGIIMAVDNMLALFMLPIFGALSDKTKSAMGKRMPYILAGTILAVILFPFIPIMYATRTLWGLFVLIALVLISMNVYRAPAVALMPDITPKPLRSKANGIINFVGFLGAIAAGGLTMIYAMPLNLNTQSDIIMPFIITSVLMVVALIVLYSNIKENQLAKEVKEDMELGEKLAETNEKVEAGKPLGKLDLRNLRLIIVSVFLWFMAFNAIETFWSTYGVEHLGEVSTSLGLATIVLTIASLITFIPAGYVANKIGRKFSVMLGLTLMVGGLISATFIPTFGPTMLGLFAVAGIGWAFVNVNSYPMVVEMASNQNVGKYTGYYYTSSMVAQSVTPIFMGALMDIIGYQMFFPYAAVFAAISLVVFSFIKINKKTEVKDEGLLERMADL